MKRTFFSTWAMLLLVGSYAVATEDDPYQAIGQSVRRVVGCRTAYSFKAPLRVSRCEGLKPDLPDADLIDDPSVIRRLVALRWEGRVGPAASLAGVAGSPAGAEPRAWVESISKADEIALARMGSSRYVAARIIADPYGPPDRRYGLGFTDSLTASRRSGVYYLVVHTYSDSSSIEYGNDTIGLSKQIARWDVYAAETSGSSKDAVSRLVRVKSSGSVRYCAHQHLVDGTIPSANFWSCSTLKRSQELSRDRTATLALAHALREDTVIVTREPSIEWVIGAARRFEPEFGRSLPTETQARIAELRALLELNDNPVWFRCGVGCCIADVDAF